MTPIHQTPTARLIVAELRLSPQPLSREEIVDATGASYNTVYEYVRALLREGLVTRSTRGRRAVFSAPVPASVEVR